MCSFQNPACSILLAYVIVFSAGKLCYSHVNIISREELNRIYSRVTVTAQNAPEAPDFKAQMCGSGHYFSPKLTRRR